VTDAEPHDRTLDTLTEQYSLDGDP